jgi:uncharacterized protein (TIGR02265 family)
MSTPPEQPTKPERMISQTTIDALIKSHQADQSPYLLKEIKELSGYDHYHLKKEYPQRVFVIIGEIFVKKFYPDLPIAEAISILARKQARTFMEETIVGRVTYALLGKTTHHKLLQRFLITQNQQFNFGERTLEITGPKQARLIFKDDTMLPLWAKPMLETVLEMNKAVNPQVTYTVIAKNHTVYDLSWDA